MKQYFAKTGIVLLALGVALLAITATVYGIIELQKSNQSVAEHLPALDTIVYIENPKQFLSYSSKFTPTVSNVLTSLPQEALAVFAIQNSTSGSTVGFVVPASTPVTPSANIYTATQGAFTFVTGHEFSPVSPEESLQNSKSFTTLQKQKSSKNWLYATQNIFNSNASGTLLPKITQPSGISILANSIIVDTITDNISEPIPSYNLPSLLPNDSKIYFTDYTAFTELATLLMNPFEQRIGLARVEYIWQEIAGQTENIDTIRSLGTKALQIELGSTNSGAIVFAVSGIADSPIAENKFNQIHEDFAAKNSAYVIQNQTLGSNEFSTIQKNSELNLQNTQIDNWNVTTTRVKDAELTTATTGEKWLITTVPSADLAQKLTANTTLTVQSLLQISPSTAAILPLQSLQNVQSIWTMYTEQLPQIKRTTFSTK